MRRTPSAMSCSIIARLPVILGMVGLQESFEGFRAKDRAPPGYSQAARSHRRRSKGWASAPSAQTALD
jgi:hypothetical protein